MEREFSFTPGEVDVITEALQIQRERWQDARIKRIANDPSVSTIPLEEIDEGIRRHEDLLRRFGRR